MTEKDFARFLSKIQHLSNGCWQWTGTISRNGYGRFTLNRKQALAHRVSYVHFTGGISIGLEIDHLCRNRACVNPLHLEAVIHQVNVIRGLVPIVTPIRMLGNTNMLGKTHTAETKARMSQARLGYQMPAESRARLSAAKKGRPGHKLSPEARAKIAASKLGRKRGPMSPEQRAKIAAGQQSERAQRGRAKVHAGNVGRTCSEETKAQMSASRLAYFERKRNAVA